MFTNGHFFLVVNGQILKTIKAIWSHWLDPGSIWLGQNTSNPMGHGTESILLVLGIKYWLALKIGRCLCRSQLHPVGYSATPIEFISIKVFSNEQCDQIGRFLKVILLQKYRKYLTTF